MGPSRRAAARTRALLAAGLVLGGAPALALDPRLAATQLLRDRWDAGSGLPVQAGTALLQDARGYLWVGTQEGAARFDGVRFVVYGQRNSTAFRNDLVHALAETPDGAVWVGTHAGLVRLQAQSETLYSTAQGLPAQAVTATAVARDGTLWIGTGGGGLARYQGGRFEAVGPGQLDVRTLLAGPDGFVWAGTSAGVFQVASAGGTPTVTPLARTGPLATATVTALALDSAGTLLVGTAPTGLHAYRQGVVAPARLGDVPPDLDVTSLCWDSTATLWIGTRTRGLWRVRGHPGAAATVETLEAADTVSAVSEDRAGNVWFTTVAGGLARLSSPLLTAIGAREGLSNAAATAVLQDQKGRVWVGTLAGLNLLTSDHSAVPVAPALLGRAAILALHEDPGGRVWVGTRNGLFRCRDQACVAEDAAGVKEDVQAFAFDPEPDVLWIGTGRGLVRKTRRGSTLLTVADGLPHDRVSLLFRDRAGVLWVGTEAGGLARYQGGRFERLTSPAHPDLAGSWALSARQDADGGLWFGTSVGLVHVRGEGLGIVGRQAGLVCADAFAILPGRGDELWLSCNRGLTRVRRADLLAFERGLSGHLPVSHYAGRSVGLSGECVGSVSPAGLVTRDGRLWFSTLQGLVFLDPRRLTAPAPPAVVVESLQAGEGQKLAQGPGPFAAGTRHVEIAYTALELTRPEQVRFRYRLEGVDDDWTSAGSRRLAIYPNLGPGRYRFQVEAALEGGAFGAAAVAEFGIREYFHQTLAFRVGLGLLAAGLAAAGYRRRVRALAARGRELEAIVDRRTAELQGALEEQRRMAERLRAMADEMREQSLRDPLTGLRNRRFLLEVLGSVTRPVWGQPGPGAARSRDEAANTGVGVALIDIDHFKQVNDTYGHDAGDEVLRQFAQRAAAAIRPGDVAARWGGEEFLVALTATDPRHLAAFVERLRETLAGEPFVLPAGTRLRLTCSAGHAALPFVLEGGPTIGVGELIALADLGLSAAKRGGRDRAVGVVAGPQRGVSADLLRKALGSVDLAVAEGVVALVPGER